MWLEGTLGRCRLNQGQKAVEQATLKFARVDEKRLHTTIVGEQIQSLSCGLASSLERGRRSASLRCAHRGLLRRDTNEMQRIWDMWMWNHWRLPRGKSERRHAAGTLGECCVSQL